MCAFRHFSQFGRWLFDALPADKASERQVMKQMTEVAPFTKAQAKLVVYGDETEPIRDNPKAEALRHFLIVWGAHTPDERQRLLAMLLRSVAPSDFRFVVDAMDDEIEEGWQKANESSSALHQIFDAMGGSDAKSAIQSVRSLGRHVPPERWEKVCAILESWIEANKKPAE